MGYCLGMAVRCGLHNDVSLLGMLMVVSLTFRELTEIISRKYAMPEITFMVRISSWNPCMCAQSMALGTRKKFQLEILTRSRFLQCTNFERISWRSLETFVKQTQPIESSKIKIGLTLGLFGNRRYYQSGITQTSPKFILKLCISTIYILHKSFMV